jgi:hypothetical protein
MEQINIGRQRTIVKILVLVTLVVLVIALVAYGCKFPTISTVNSDWGEFGSFIGGIAGPLFSLLTIMVMWLTLLDQRIIAKDNELKLINQNNDIKEQLKNSQDSLTLEKKKFDKAEKDEMYNTYIKLFQTFDTQLSALLALKTDLEMKGRGAYPECIAIGIKMNDIKSYGLSLIDTFGPEILPEAFIVFYKRYYTN